jgi:hypothetical protein
MLPCRWKSVALGDEIRNLGRTAKMGKDAAAIRREFHTRLSQIARELTRELYPDGLPRGTKFSELEAIAGALGDEMARQLIEINVQEQADDWPEQELGECPACGGPARKAPDQPRVLMTTRGDVVWKQRVANCPRCRRAFFPSESSVGR